MTRNKCPDRPLMVIHKGSSGVDRDRTRYHALRAILRFLTVKMDSLEYRETASTVVIRVDPEAQVGDYAWVDRNVFRRIYLSESGSDVETSLQRGDELVRIFDSIPGDNSDKIGLGVLIGAVTELNMVYDIIRWDRT